MKKILIILLAFLCVGCSSNKNNDNNELNIVTTIYPYYDFTRAIIGSEDNITLLLKPNSELHTYEPTPKDIVSINQADIFIYNGGESDSWVEEVLDSIDNKDLKVIKLIDYVEVIEEHDEIDEHIWTSINNSIKLTEVIKDNLIDLDEINKDKYIKNTEKYTNKLKLLDEEVKEIVNSSNQKPLIFGDRFPLIYFFKEYNIDYLSAYHGCESHSEVSSKTIQHLIDTIKDKDIKYVFHLELSNKNICNTIKDSTGVEIREFSSIHNVSKEDFDNNLTYIDIMKRNIEVLREALND